MNSKSHAMAAGTRVRQLHAGTVELRLSIFKGGSMAGHKRHTGILKKKRVAVTFGGRDAFTVECNPEQTPNNPAAFVRFSDGAPRSIHLEVFRMRGKRKFEQLTI
jgi:hypothetical protein